MIAKRASDSQRAYLCADERAWPALTRGRAADVALRYHRDRRALRTGGERAPARGRTPNKKCARMSSTGQTRRRRQRRPRSQRRSGRAGCRAACRAAPRAHRRRRLIVASATYHTHILRAPHIPRRVPDITSTQTLTRRMAMRSRQNARTSVNRRGRRRS